MAAGAPTEQLDAFALFLLLLAAAGAYAGWAARPWSPALSMPLRSVACGESINLVGDVGLWTC